MLSARYAAFGRWIIRHRGWVVAFWLLLMAVASLGSTRVTQVLSGGSGSVPDSPSQRVEALLHREFANPYTHLVAVVVSSREHTLDSAEFRLAVDDLKAELQGQKEVARVLGPGDQAPMPLRSEKGDRAVLLLGLNAKGANDALNMVPRIREVAHAVQAQHQGDDPSLKVAATGMPAVLYDINRYSSDDTSRAEGRLIPLTLLVLLFAFGGLVAAGLPLLVGVAATVLTLGLTYVLAQTLELSIYVQNVASMIGLAVGIDYSLLMVHRFRLSLERHQDTNEAVTETMATAGVAITFSGLTVLIGLGAMWFTPLLDTRSVGLGGLLVVIVSVLLALTLLPAVLSMLGPRIDAPKRLTNWMLAKANRRQWERWVRYILERPWRATLASLVLLLALAAPLLKLELGYPDTELFPPYMESVQGVDALKEMGMTGALIPIYAIVKDPDAPVLGLKNLPALLKLSADLKSNPLIASVASPVDLAPGITPLQYAMLYQNPTAALGRYPLIKEMFVSRDRHMALFQVIPKRSVDLPALRKFASELAKREMPKGLEFMVGGTPTYYNDHEGSVVGTFPYVAGFIVLTTLVIMAIAFRSILVPLKAVVMNLMSVGAGCGAVVAVYELGWGRAIFGMGHVHEAMPVPVLIFSMLFCIVFGLSMDYEVFLMSAIKESYDAHGDNTRAVIEGTCGTARLISSAALIMVAVFGAFAWADFVIVKMLGLGLAVAVLVDATVIRLVLLPAFMKLAGRANWYPGDRTAKLTPQQEPANV
ncbi:MAG TPA: MMPL family transporter [Stenomitos sp.]